MEVPVSNSLSFLSRFPDHEVVIGPLQRPEALFIHSLVLVLRPKRIVELGFYKGDSCAALAAAAQEINRLTGFQHSNVESYDIRVNNDDEARIVSEYPGTVVRVMDQLDVHNVEGGEIDFLFIDAAHNLAINKDTWTRLEPRLSPNAMVMVHDTGLWVDAYRPSSISRQGMDGVIRGDVTGCFHQPDEVAFVKWVTKTYTSWTKMDFMSVHAFRHGFTLLQRILL
jgi:predicted O-methyltransferase YrrM